jgi:CTP:molybdopterin cytidylyltransferase MocA
MGREKILLPFGRATMLETVLDKLALARVSRIAVILRPDLPAAERIARAAGAEVRINPDPDDEMLVSIRLGVELLLRETDALFIWPADHPAVAPPTLDLLIAGASRETVRLPLHGGRRGHPALAGVDVLAGIGEIPAGEGLRWLWRERAGSVDEVDVVDPGVIENLDDPETYERARRREEERAGGDRAGR